MTTHVSNKYNRRYQDEIPRYNTQYSRDALRFNAFQKPKS